MNLIRKITNPELIDAVFFGELNLDDVEISSMLLHVGPNLVLSFDQQSMPETVPAKWKLKKFNMFSFRLEFSNLTKVHINHWEPLLKCSPVISETDKGVSLKIIKGNECIISCESSFLTLSDVKGYINNYIV